MLIQNDKKHTRTHAHTPQELFSERNKQNYALGERSQRSQPHLPLGTWQPLRSVYNSGKLTLWAFGMKFCGE